MSRRNADLNLGTTYKGFDIRYSENEDRWRCYDLDLDGATLTAVKRKIAEYSRATRRTDLLSTFRLDHSGGYIPVFVTTGAETTTYDWDTKKHLPEIWVVAADGASTRRIGSKGREKVAINQLVPDTPEARAAIDEWQRLSAIAEKAKKERNRAKDKIPRLTLDDIRKAPTVDINAEEEGK